MIAYEVYSRKKGGKEDFIGILPERRKNPKRMTKNSVLNWGWKIVSNNSSVSNIYFVKVNVPTSPPRYPKS